eukprot:CAMPEP_0184649402 /NCGR_PEP_ID=MMETSP0308-20130426/6760_1 /TAXON_ID=38269 /ORGANISM="Gloeochaete witrockiana, Strain SAG 46.84" /LENGTH=249 /DNA_ID=CAMNT_0027082089 /DNA_START=63 /DNA_END=812 /DNA_ORIENTATION=-
MGRKVFIGGNWKCNGTVASVTALVDILNKGEISDKVEVVVSPTYVHIPLVKASLRKDISVSAQDIWYEKSGAFTGAISADQIKDIGLNWTIIGHSERRSVFKDTDEIIAKKTTAALNAGLNVIACIGELLSERQAGDTLKVNFRQLEAYVGVVKDWSKIVIAYEPVWAIGTGVTASPEQAQEVHKALRLWLAEKVSPEVAESVRIIYGGSVTAGNAKELIGQADIDGFLVGGASLKPDFLTIIAAGATK